MMFFFFFDICVTSLTFLNRNLFILTIYTVDVGYRFVSGYVMVDMFLQNFFSYCNALAL